MLRIRVGFELVLETTMPTPTASIVRPRQSDLHQILTERWFTTPSLAIHEYRDHFDNYVWRWTTPPGQTRLLYDAIATSPTTPDPTFADLPATPVEQLPDDVLIYTLPSRYCPSDLVSADAWQLFGHVDEGWQRIQAICDWTHQNIEYGYGNSHASTSGYDAYQDRKGVCRDFAHIAVMFCRAVNIPARYVYGYLPDIGVPFNPTPMDFHAWFEAYVGGTWHTFDARHNMPRIGRVMIARGRDAVDTAILTSYGATSLVGFIVWADEVDETVTLETPLPALNR